MSYNVFQYDERRSKKVKVDEDNIKELREILAEFVFLCLKEERPVSKEDFEKKIKILPVGSYSPRKDSKDKFRACLKDLIWKYTELTGKYCGCQYWSVAAKSLFDQDRNSSPMKDRYQLAKCLCDRKLIDNNRFEHEHVFPIKRGCENFVDYLSGLSKSSISHNEIKALLDRLAVGCVVTGSEHKKVHKIPGNFENPWLRYEGKIQLVPNPNWQPPQIALIKQARLVLALQP